MARVPKDVWLRHIFPLVTLENAAVLLQLASVCRAFFQMLRTNPHLVDVCLRHFAFMSEPVNVFLMGGDMSPCAGDELIVRWAGFEVDPYLDCWSCYHNEENKFGLPCVSKPVKVEVVGCLQRLQPRLLLPESGFRTFRWSRCLRGHVFDFS